ncbi:hypothetical protein Tco_1319931 [Tanacetum coccineum]
MKEKRNIMDRITFPQRSRAKRDAISVSPKPPKNRSSNNIEPVSFLFRSMPRDDPIIERIPRRSLKKRNITPFKNELPHIGSNVTFEENMISRFNIGIARRIRDGRNIHTTRREIQSMRESVQGKPSHKHIDLPGDRFIPSSSMNKSRKDILVNPITSILNDTCTWSLGHNGTFTVKDARYRIDQNILPTLVHATTWDKSIPRRKVMCLCEGFPWTTSLIGWNLLRVLLLGILYDWIISWHASKEKKELVLCYYYFGSVVALVVTEIASRLSSSDVEEN